MKNKKALWLIVLLISLSVTACSGLTINGNDNGDLRASGRISALQVDIASEVGGIVQEIKVEEGDSIKTGDILFQIDNTLLQAQYNQAVAMVDMAKTAIESANAQLAAVELQLEITLQGLRQQKQLTVNSAWQESQPDDFYMPVWYFTDNESLVAADQEVQAAEEALIVELNNLETVIEDYKSSDLIAVEERLAKAQAAYQIAELTLEQAKNAEENEELEDIAQDLFDEASSELDATQSSYDRILTTAAAKDILEARSRFAVAQRLYENALNNFSQLQTGTHSLQFEAAKAAVTMAETGVAQAEANLLQAQTALEVFEIQLDKFVVKAPIDGIVLSRNLEGGEMIVPGSVTIVIGQLEEVRLTVYIPEDKYGQIQLGQSVTISVDSFPDEIFHGQIIRIAEEAEFTPRNVQTVEGRLATVYAVDILVPNSNLKLKPGMPADIVINIP